MVHVVSSNQFCNIPRRTIFFYFQYSFITQSCLDLTLCTANITGEHEVPIEPSEVTPGTAAAEDPIYEEITETEEEHMNTGAHGIIGMYI